MHRFRSLSSKARHRFQRAIAEWPAMKLTGLSHIVIWHKYLKSKLLLKWFLSVPCVLAIHIELYKHIIYTSIPTFKSLCYLVGFFLLSHVIYEFRTRIMYVLLFIPVFFFLFRIVFWLFEINIYNQWEIWFNFRNNCNTTLCIYHLKLEHWSNIFVKKDLKTMTMYWY